MHKPGQPVHILMADDDPDDRLMAEQAFQQYRLKNGVVFVEDGQELMDYLLHQCQYADAEQFPLPDLILLDLNMPLMGGQEVLAEVKADDSLRTIPVVILTTSRTESDVGKAYGHSANCYITKPVDFDAFAEVVRSIESFWFTVVTLPPDDLGAGPGRLI